MEHYEYTVDQYIIKTVERLGIEGAAFELELYEPDVRNKASVFVDYLKSYKGRKSVSENVVFLNRMIQDADEKHQESLHLLNQKIQDLNFKHQEHVDSLRTLLQETTGFHVNPNLFEKIIRSVENFGIQATTAVTGACQPAVRHTVSSFIEYLKSAGSSRVPQYVRFLERLIQDRNVDHQRFLEKMQNQDPRSPNARLVNMMVQDSKANHKAYIETLQKMIQEANIERDDGSQATVGMLANRNQGSSLMASNEGSTRGGVTMGTGAGPSSGGMTTAATIKPPILGIAAHEWPALSSKQKKNK